MTNFNTSDIVKAESSGEDPRATGGLVSNLAHPRVNKTKQHTQCLSLLPADMLERWQQVYRVRIKFALRLHYGAKRRHIAGRAYDTGHGGSKATSKWQ